MSDKKLAKKVKDHVRQRLVTQDEFYDRLNERVFQPHLGRDLTFNEAKNIVHGIGDVIFEITHEGNSVRFGRLGTFKPHTTPSGPRWNPNTHEKFDGPERRKLAFKQSRSTKELLAAAG